jgi:hypothetical protein
LVPDQSPEAAQDVALLEVQLSVDEPPIRTEFGVALSASVGGGAGGVTLTVTVWEAVPPGPVQARAKDVVAANPDRASEPLTGRAPLHPPEAVQAVAFDDVQPRVDVPPLATVAGAAVRDTLGNGAGVTVIVTDCEAVPLALAQVIV